MDAGGVGRDLISYIMDSPQPLQLPAAAGAVVAVVDSFSGEFSMFYAGIGSRKTPADVLVVMTDLARKLSEQGWTLRSGAAAGADSAFEAGSSRSEIFLPWPGFNGSKSALCHPSTAALAMAAQFHPAWDRCSRGARLLHARNCHQILGQDLATPVQLVICWSDGSGGTEQALRIARHYHIQVRNLFDPTVFAAAVKFLG